MKLTREQFAAVVGYQGSVAVMDRKLLKSLKGLSPHQALEEGMFRAALSLAIYDGQGLEKITEELAERYQKPLRVEDAMRMFGVYSVPEDIERVLSL